MSRTAYVNGAYVRQADACVHIEDRGFQFADGVYEVWSVFSGKLAEWKGHADRLQRSLHELSIDMPVTLSALQIVLRETIRRNRLVDGIVYLQITRGRAPRDHAFPAGDVPPTVVVTCKRMNFAAMEIKAGRGVGVKTTPENRWGRCDIKTVGLLPNVLAKQAAHEAGAYEAWFVDDLGLVTEGSSTNAWIVDADGVLRTRDANANILRGITRHSLIDIAREAGVEVSERPFSVDEAKGAREAFLTSASAFVTPIVSVDGATVGDGKPGPVSRRLRALYVARARETAV